MTPENAAEKKDHGHRFLRGPAMEQPSELLTSLQTESVADGASLQTPNSVQKYMGGVFFVLRSVRAFWQRYVDVFLGAVLVLAGALKGQQLLTDPSMGLASGFPRALLIGAAAFELAFGCWLFAGLYGWVTRWIALAWFTSLAAVALAQTAGGAASCACFGALHTSPWLMLSFDVAAVAALWKWSPNDHSSPRHLPLVLCLCLLPATAFLGLTGAPRNRTLFAEIDLGSLAQGGCQQQAFQCCNDSGTLVEVAAIETSCPCASIHLERTGIPAGQCLKGNVTLDLDRERDFVGDLAIEAKGLTRGGRVAFRLVIRARVNKAGLERQRWTVSMMDG